MNIKIQTLLRAIDDLENISFKELKEINILDFRTLNEKLIDSALLSYEMLEVFYRHSDDELEKRVDDVNCLSIEPNDFDAE
ncbi:hypothetical protein [Vibrio parahaemolyticus]|uniref:hypothetical protein n=1 Tax=Vibrio parahaemolyticus TaxID=670 RepID=UPI0004D37FA4|nr:hypothetical protein [Vibrio parahaemolyticus]OQT82928.1 hypothetical protein EM98_000100 [Vibrio parahaemolyticus]